MGVPEFLAKALEFAGRDVDLRDYKDGVPVQRSDEDGRPQGKNIHRNDRKRNRPCDSLRDGKEERPSSRRRPLRIGIDAHSWIYKAAHGFGDMLGDERHLTNYGRAALLEEQQQQPQQQDPSDPGASTITDYVQACTKYVITRLQTLQETSQARVLVVLDGKTPPIKAKEVAKRRYQAQQLQQERDGPVHVHDININTGDVGDDDPDRNNHEEDHTYENRQAAANDRRTKAFKRAGPGPHVFKIIAHLLEALKATQIPFLVAPYEADGQLAYLLRQNLIDMVITEDSDLIAHGGTSLLYKSVANIGIGIPAGQLLQFQDLGAGVDRMKSRASLQLMDFTPVMVAVLFVLLGCDYCERKLKGIGIITAQRIVRTAFLEQRTNGIGSHQGRSSDLPHDALSIVWQEAYSRCSEKKALTPQFRSEFEEAFLEALLMYRHPIVYDPIIGRCFLSRQYDKLGDPELLENRQYAELCADLTRVYNVVGDLPSGDHDATVIAEGNDVTWRGSGSNPTNSFAGVMVTDPNEVTGRVPSHESQKTSSPKGGVPGDGGSKTITRNSIDTVDCIEHLDDVDNHRRSYDKEAGEMRPSHKVANAGSTIERVRELDFGGVSDVEETQEIKNFDARKTRKTNTRFHKSLARKIFEVESSPSLPAQRRSRRRRGRKIKDGSKNGLETT